jgi:hypothetical protein
MSLPRPVPLMAMIAKARALPLAFPSALIRIPRPVVQWCRSAWRSSPALELPQPRLVFCSLLLHLRLLEIRHLQLRLTKSLRYNLFFCLISASNAFYPQPLAKRQKTGSVPPIATVSTRRAVRPSTRRATVAQEKRKESDKVRVTCP